MDERVQAIRACPLVGNGTHSDIDDFFTDGDLAEALDFAGVVSVEEALAWARQGQQAASEQPPSPPRRPPFEGPLTGPS
jgi:hypothetical protein